MVAALRVTVMSLHKAVGGVLSTTKVALGPAAGEVFPRMSVAVPAAILIPSVPVPVMPLMVTVRVAPEPDTPIVPAAVPVAFNVMLAGARVLALNPLSPSV